MLLESLKVDNNFEELHVIQLTVCGRETRLKRLTKDVIMDPVELARKKRYSRLEDSFSLPENQMHLPVDYLVEEEDHKLVEKWHEKNLKEAQERLMHTA